MASEIILGSEDLQTVLSNLADVGWAPAVLQSEQEFYRAAGVVGRVRGSRRRPRAVPRRFLRGDTFGGDVFFRDSDVYYVTAHSEEEVVAVVGDLGEEEVVKSRGHLEIGVISNRANGLPQRFETFVQAVKTAMQPVVEERGLTVEWKEVRPNVPRIVRALESGGDQTEVRFSRANATVEEIQAAHLLASKSARETLIEISQAGFVRERDIIGRGSKDERDARQAIAELRSTKLLNAEYLLECRKTNTPLTRLSEREKLVDTEVANLLCPSCNSRFSSELLTEGYSLSDLGRKLTRQSFWMTVWITELLIKLGMHGESIYWSISESGEEVDMLVALLGELWIFELKDREFGAGDAYPLNYRLVRYRANRAFVVTTERVSPDARRVFEDLSREALRPSRFGPGAPAYIEGLDSAEAILRREISGAALRYAQERLGPIEEWSGFDLNKIISVRFEETAAGTHA